MPRRNVTTSLKRRPRTNPMQAYDALPADLRQWLATAALPWSAASARRAWSRALKSTRGDRQAARAALCALEHQRLERDVARIWGKAHPFFAASRETPPPEADIPTARCDYQSHATGG